MNSLDLTYSEFKSLLDESTDLVLRHFENLENRKAFHNFSQKEIVSWFDEPLPEDPANRTELLRFFEEKVIDTATGNAGPHMYAYVLSGSNHIGIVAEKLTAAISQNATKWHLGPAASEIEKRVIQWTAELTGFGNEAGGILVSGGSAANLDGLTVARNIYFEQYGIREKGLFAMKPFLVYASEETHNCIDKSVDLLGLGSNHLRKIGTRSDFTIDLEELEEKIITDIRDGFHPFCLVGNAGTVNTGAIDNFEALHVIAKKYKMWLHVDGAYGALAASLDAKKELYKGLELVDSLALDFHKWLYQPFEAGCLLVKNWEYLKRTYFNKASYLDNSLEELENRLDFNEHQFQLSRNAKALKVWLSIKFYGIRKLKEMIAKDIELTEHLNSQITKSDDFELIAGSPLSISCFRYNGNLTDRDEIIKLNRKLIPALEKDGRVFITGTTIKGEFVLRACLINHRKSRKSVDYLLEVISEVGQSVINQ